MDIVRVLLVPQLASRAGTLTSIFLFKENLDIARLPLMLLGQRMASSALVALLGPSS